MESESNAEDDEQKINRVDMLVENEQKERLIIELQYSKEFDFRNDGRLALLLQEQ